MSSFIQLDRLRRSALMATGLSVGVTGVVYAQGAPVEPAVPAERDRFAFEVSARATYDSNVGGGNKDLAAARGIRPEDLIYEPSATVSLQQPLGRQLLFVTARGQLLRHQRNSRLDGENADLVGGVASQIGRCQGSGIGQYARHTTTISEVVTTASKNVAETTGASASATCLFGPLQAGLSASYQELANSAKTGGYVDSESEVLGGQVGYANATLGTLAVTGQFRKVKYGDSNVTGLVRNPDFDSYSIGLSLKRKIGLRLEGEAEASYTSVDSEGVGEDFEGWTASSAITYRASSRTRLVFAYDRGVSPSSLASSSFTVQEALKFTAYYTLSQRTSIDVGGTLEKNRFKGLQPSFRAVRRDKLQSVFITARTKIGRYLSFELGAQAGRRNADLPEFDERDTRITTAIVGRF